MRQQDQDIIEKLRDELFDYRVDIKSYKKSISTIIAATSILLAIFGFFGYDRIDDYGQYIIEQTNERLAKTDSLLYSMDTERIDSLRKELDQKTMQYKELINNIESMISENKKIELALFYQMPTNQKVSHSIARYKETPNADMYDIIHIDNKVKALSPAYIYIKLNPDTKYTDDDIFIVTVYPKNRRVQIFTQAYKIEGLYNKLSYAIEKFEDYKDYSVEIWLATKTGQEYELYHSNKAVSFQ